MRSEQISWIGIGKHLDNPHCWVVSAQIRKNLDKARNSWRALITFAGMQPPMVTTPVDSLNKWLNSHELGEFKKSRKWIPQMPAYHAYPPSGDAEPSPFPKPFSESVAVIRVMYLTLL